MLRKGMLIREHEPRVVFLNASSRINLVTAEDKKIAALGAYCLAFLRGDHQVSLGQVVSNGVGGVPAISRVANVIDPEWRLLMAIVMRSERGGAKLPAGISIISRDGFDQTWIGMTSEHGGYRHKMARPEQLEGGVPADAWLGFFGTH